MSQVNIDGVNIWYDIHGDGLDLLFPHHEMTSSHVRMLGGQASLPGWRTVGVASAQGGPFACLADMWKDQSMPQACRHHFVRLGIEDAGEDQVAVAGQRPFQDGHGFDQDPGENIGGHDVEALRGVPA